MEKLIIYSWRQVYQMSFSVTLASISSYITNQSANLDHQIDRLEKAKQAILREQNYALLEWNRDLIPTHENYWEGIRDISFQDYQKRAYKGMQRIFHDEYDEYIQRINSSINCLGREKNVLSFARSLTQDAERLLKKGKVSAEELQKKINQIRRHI